MLGQSTIRALLPIGFFGGLIAILMLGESLGPTQATTVVINGPNLHVQQTPPPAQSLPRCKTNSDCPLPTTYCGKSGKCTHLEEPICDCSQPQVMRCFESSGKARFLFCSTACVETDGGAICQ
ncbi:MAG: hypothetical protein QF793_00380 [Candidatus Peribacteraceae bacterium]|jgi:hypothetical protein|nr:hypothetical protein [Candidatus Peribacteraceae bacterium]